ncbi:MAG: serine/threonine-protein kinase [Myxococcales bacterium]|nr:serine/threonine-protein kinase [Myxococcales bacterium]
MEHTVAKGARLSRGGSRAPATTRYQLKGELARGGMGVVHRAVDLVTGREVALKRLLERSERGNVLALFEREFRTLRSLRHPRIIEVYDYGVADGAAYYTMELLSGTDLGKLAPLPYRQACAHLRDLASSLALLQARRLVHRDVSPRNARVTADGRCKLLDFGALTGFGVPTQVVGTPPCIPPEVVRGAALDQRADLYSLGATAYFVLTGRHAYPVRSIAELNHAWTQAIPQPSQYASDIPPALDALVMSLLHHDPLARPESAAEVIDRLGVIGELASDLEPQAEASYFFSTELIGRKEQLKRAQDMLRAATEGEGSALLFRGLPGTGRTRLLSEVCVQAQLAGATVLQVDAQQERGENSVAVALLAKLLDAASDDVLRAAKPHASVLGSLLPQLAGKLSVEGNHQRPEAPGEWRGQVLSACLGWLSSVAKVRPVVVAVDNLDVVDDASTALLAALAAEAKSASLMVVGTLLSGAEPATSGVRFLLEHGKSIELLALSAEQTGALARAIFGEVPNVMRLGEWLHRTSGGIASHCLELASELRRSGAVSYAGGTWVLPDDAQLASLPRGMTEAMQARLRHLSPAALSEVCVQAQLAGATVLQVDAQQERGENSVAVALLAKLLDAASDDVLRAAKPHASVLGSLLPQLAGKLSVEGNHQRPEAPGEWRGQVLSACLGWLSSVAKVRPVVVAVDNLDVVDDASTALLAALAAEAKSASLMVVGTLLSGAEPATSGVRFLLEHGKSIELLALSAEQTGALARAIFGEVPNVMRLGEWLHRTSGGIASHCLELASELRRSGAVSYAGGTWVLPDDAQLASLPRGMTEAMQARLRHLSPAALTLAQALSVHGSPLEVSTCRLVSDEIGLSDMFALLDELVGNDVLAIAGDRYRFRQEGLRSLLLSENEPARVARLHGVMADALLGTTYADDRMVRVEAGWHMLRSGQELRGAQLLASAALAFEIGTGSLQAAVPALEEARRVFLQERRSLYELLPTVTRLAAEGYYSDRRLSTRYAEEAFGLLRRATGLSLADRLQPMLGGNIAVRLGLAVAALRFYLTPRARRPASFSDVFVLMVNCVTTQAGAGTVCLDTEATRRAAEFMQPLKRLGPDHMLSAIADYCTLLMKMTQEQQPEVHAGWIKLLERLSDPAQFSDLPDYVRQLYRGGALFALGIVETWHDGDEALVRAQELESLGLRIYDRAAQQIRMLYHAGRGELDRAEDYRRKMEIHAIQTGAAWQVDVTLPLTSSVIYGPLGDLVRIKRASEQIEQLATRYEVAALARTARAAYGSYLLWRGSPDKARSVLEPIVCGTEPRSYVGWSRSLAVIADAYNREGLHAEALRLCEHGLAHVRPEDRRFVRMFLGLEVQRALAKAGLGDLVEAEAELMDLLAEHQSFENPVTLGAIREALAQVAVLSEDSEAFMEHAAAVEALYRPTRVPSLIARAEKLGRRGAQTLGLPARGVGGFSVVRSPAESVSLELSKCSTADARHTRALQLLLESSRCREGHLFLVEGSTPRLVASSEGPPAATLEQQAAVLASRLREDSETYMGATQGTLAVSTAISTDDPDYCWHLLYGGDARGELIGLAVARDEDGSQPIEFTLLQAITDGLSRG